MYGLSTNEIKSICHHAHFFIITYGSFQHLTNLTCLVPKIQERSKRILGTMQVRRWIRKCVTLAMFAEIMGCYL